jgi:hypothetical protein
MTMFVELDSVSAAYAPHCGDVLPSKLPVMMSVGMSLVVISRAEEGALGTFQTAQSSVMKGSCGA